MDVLLFYYLYKINKTQKNNTQKYLMRGRCTPKKCMVIKVKRLFKPNTRMSIKNK